jgi:hypothetical protein
MARESKIIIAKNIKIDKEYKEVLNYTEAQMLSLVETNKVASALDYSFIRDKGTISTNFTYSQALQCNYMAFQNKDYSNKWFFAWIEDVRYVNDGTTEISYTVDAWSTWFEKLNVGQSFVIREHVNDDTIGANTVPENIETGEFVVNNVSYDAKLSDTCICTMFSDDSTTTISDVKGDVYNGVYSGCKYDLTNRNSAGVAFQNQRLSDYDNAGKGDAIVGMFMAPTGVIPGWDPESTIGIQLGATDTPYTWNNESITINSTLDGYTPKNNKLFTFPYNYLAVSNNNGVEKIYNYEYFTNRKPNFKIDVSICPGCSIKMKPLNYKGVAENELEGIIGGKYPTCSWSTDLFVNWATQNAVNMGLGLAGNLLQIGSGFANQNAGAISSGTQGIFSQIGQVYEHQLTPDSARGNINCGDVVAGAQKNTFYFYQYSMKQEFAKIADDFFTRYGYKVNRLKTPNITGRTYWNYIQIASEDTLGSGEIPQKFMDEINRIARQGTTIWHNHNNIGNYSLNNTIS